MYVRCLHCNYISISHLAVKAISCYTYYIMYCTTMKHSNVLKTFGDISCNKGTSTNINSVYDTLLLQTSHDFIYLVIDLFGEGCFVYHPNVFKRILVPK